MNDGLGHGIGPCGVLEGVIGELAQDLTKTTPELLAAHVGALLAV